MSDFYQRQPQRRAAFNPYGANDPAFDDAVSLYKTQQAAKAHEADQGALTAYRNEQLGLTRDQRRQAAEDSAFRRRDAEAKFAETQAMNEERKLNMGVTRQSAEALTAERLDKAARMKKAQKASILSTALKRATLLGQSLDAVAADMPDAVAHLRKRFPNLATMKPDELQRHIDFLDEVAADAVDYTGAGKQARTTALTLKRAELADAAAKEREAQRLEGRKELEAFKQQHKDATSAAAMEEAIGALGVDFNFVGVMEGEKVVPGRAVKKSQLEAFRNMLERGESAWDAGRKSRIEPNPPKFQASDKWWGAKEADAKAKAEAEAEQEARLKDTYMVNGELVVGKPQAFAAPDAGIKAEAAQAAEAQMVQRGALTPQPAPDIPTTQTANRAVGNAMERREMAVKAAEEAKRPATIADKYNLLDEVLKSNRNPNTGQPLTAAEVTQVKAAMANFRKRLTTPE